MNKALLASAALLLLPVAVSAQSTAPVQISVLSEVQLTRTGITDFGPVGTHGQTYAIDPAHPGGAQQTAAFTADGAPGATIVVSWASTLDLCHDTAGCSMKLVFTPSLSETVHSCCPRPPIQANSNPIASGASTQLDPWGVHYFYLGGSVTVNASQTPGLYSGVFTLVATYQ
jgi:Domain of unknown function (DUF4402)